MKRFLNTTKTKCESQAKYYLEANEYDLDEALNDFSEDIAWELSQKSN